MKAHRYDKDATDVFTVEEPEVHTNYYLQNRKDRYDLSISEDILRQAMMESETGVATLPYPKNYPLKSVDDVFNG